MSPSPGPRSASKSSPASCRRSFGLASFEPRQRCATNRECATSRRSLGLASRTWKDRRKTHVRLSKKDCDAQPCRERTPRKPRLGSAVGESSGSDVDENLHRTIALAIEESIRLGVLFQRKMRGHE